MLAEVYLHRYVWNPRFTLSFSTVPRAAEQTGLETNPVNDINLTDVITNLNGSCYTKHPCTHEHRTHTHTAANNTPTTENNIVPTAVQHHCLASATRKTFCFGINII